MKSRSEWTKESWVTRRAKYGTSGFSPMGLNSPRATTESALKGWVTRRKNLGLTRLKTPLPNPPKPRRQRVVQRIKTTHYPCPKCGRTKLVGCLRYDPELMYYHCPKCGYNIRDRETVAEIYALKDS